MFLKAVVTHSACFRKNVTPPSWVTPACNPSGGAKVIEKNRKNMTPVSIQIQRWLMHPEVWRFVGFAWTVVGLLCYALSTSFNFLLGNWNLTQIFVYIVFSFIICLATLFANVWQHSASLRFRAHMAFLVLTIAPVYSFFFDKAVNGKRDAFGIASCAALAMMSLSLSRRI